MVITDMEENDKPTKPEFNVHTSWKGGNRDYEIHPVAEIFPLMSDAEYADLVADISANGLVEPIWVCERQIIDGRNRYRACKEAGVPIRVRYWDPERDLADLTNFVISLNLKRRHLSESQRAVVAAKLATMRQGARTDLEPRANLPEVSSKKAAQMFNISERLVKTAKGVARDGEPEVVEAVNRGKMSLNQAAKVVKLPTAAQREIASAKAAKRKRLIEKAANAPARKTPEEKAAKAREIYEIQTSGNLFRAMELLAAFDETPAEVLAMVSYCSADRFNKDFGRALIFMQALHAAYQKWEYQNV